MNELKKFINYLIKERNYSKYTIKNYELDIKDFINYCSINKVSIYKIDYNFIKKYLVKLYDNDYKATTISRKLSSLKTFYSYLYDNNLIDNNVFKYISTPKKEKRLPKYMTNDDISIIFEIPDLSSPLGVRNRLILELLYATGIRVSELCNIKLKDIDINNKTIKVLGKGSKERIVFFGDECRDILKLYLSKRNKILNGKTNEYLIVGAYKDRPISTRSIQLIINDLIEKSALNKKITPHVFRHTFATHLLNEGCDILMVKEFLGHSSLDTTGIYTHISNERLRKVYLDTHPRSRMKK